MVEDKDLINFERRKYYRTLNKIPIPDRDMQNKGIKPEFYYIVSEKNLIKPKVLRFPFIKEYHAIKHAQINLKHRYNVLPGHTLLELGLVKALTKVKRAKFKEAQSRYTFNPNISKQRRKALRTQSRRNSRRKAQKLLSSNSNNMAEIYVLKKIEDKPAAFFKKLKLHWDYPLTYSVSFRELMVNEETIVMQDILEAAKQIPEVANKLMNIYITLTTYYSDEIFDYRNETYLTLAVKIYRKYRERIIKYLHKKGHHDEIFDGELIWKELIARGFVDKNLEQFKEFQKSRPNTYKLEARIGNLIYPRWFNDSKEALEFNTQHGINNYTKITGNG